MMDFGREMKQQREYNGLSQSKLAQLTGVKQQSISYWENNLMEPSIANCILLADFYGISIDELVGHEVKPVKENIQNKT